MKYTTEIAVMKKVVPAAAAAMAVAMALAGNVEAQSARDYISVVAGS